MKMKKETFHQLRKKYNSLELKYLCLLEEFNEELQHKVKHFRDYDNLKVLCKNQRQIIKDLKKLHH